VLVDGPRKLVVQLPRFKGEKDGRNCHQTGQRDQHRSDVGPELGLDKRLPVQLIGGVSDLVELDGGVDENADIVDDESNDLNRVLQSQSVPHEPELVQVAEHEDGKVGGDGAGFAADVRGFPVDAVLEFAEDIAAQEG
jgi:hypothetical protein